MKNAKPYRNQLAAVERRDRQNASLDRALAATVGAALKRARQEKGLKLKHVAQRTGVSISKLHEIENGIRKLITCETFDALVAAMEQEAA